RTGLGLAGASRRARFAIRGELQGRGPVHHPDPRPDLPAVGHRGQEARLCAQGLLPRAHHPIPPRTPRLVRGRRRGSGGRQVMTAAAPKKGPAVETGGFPLKEFIVFSLIGGIVVIGIISAVIAGATPKGILTNL